MKKKGSNVVQKIKQVFVSKTISNKSIDITVGMSPQKCKADFSKLSSASNKPYLSRVLHDTYIQYDEKGTKAAAASLHEERVSAAIPMYENRLVFNRPFFYAIVDTGADMPLFVGTLMSIPE